MRSVAFKEAFLNLSLFFIRFLLTLNVLRAPNISGSLSPGGAVSWTIMCQQSGDDTNDDIIMKLLMINTSPFFIGRI